MSEPARGTPDLHALLGVARDPRPSPGQRLPNQLDAADFGRLSRRSSDPGGHDSVPATAEPLPLRVGQEDIQILAVYSSKGGVGKTTIATNLAARMSHRLGLSVLVMDLDLSFGDVGPRIHKFTPTVLDAIGDPDLSAATMRRWLQRDATSGFWALLAPARPDASTDRRLLSPTAFRRLLAASSSFDVIVLDCPVELDDPLVSRFALRVANAICVVVTNERATLVDARRALDRITRPRDDADHPGYGVGRSKIGLLVNQHVEEVGVAVADIARMLPGYPIVATIPDERSAHVSAANSAEMLALADRPELVDALDLAIRSLLPQVAPLPRSLWDGDGRQLAQLQEDLQRVRWPAAPAWVRRLQRRGRRR